jgi:hypothetical protein
LERDRHENLGRATDGSEIGREAFHEWSAKSAKYDKARTDERWDHYRTSPPTKAGFGSLVYLARLHSPGWTFEGDLKRLNKLHAVLPIGGKTRVVTFGELEEFPGRETIVMTQTFQQGMLTLQRVFCLEHKGRAPQPSEVTDHRRARAALGEAEGWGRTRRRQTYARQPRSFLRARTDPAPG